MVSAQLGGSARDYQEPFASLAALLAKRAVMCPVPGRGASGRTGAGAAEQVDLALAFGDVMALAE